MCKEQKGLASQPKTDQPEETPVVNQEEMVTPLSVYKKLMENIPIT